MQRDFTTFFVYDKQLSSHLIVVLFYKIRSDPHNELIILMQNGLFPEKETAHK